MKRFSEFVKQIILCSYSIMCVIAILFLFFADNKAFWLLGIFLGTTAVAVNFLILAVTGRALVSSGSGGFSICMVISYFLGVLLCGITFIVCIKLNFSCGFGCLFGIITLPLSIFYLFLVRKKYDLVFTRRRKPGEPVKWNTYDWDDEEDGWHDLNKENETILK